MAHHKITVLFKQIKIKDQMQQKHMILNNSNIVWFLALFSFFMVMAWRLHCSNCDRPTLDLQISKQMQMLSTSDKKKSSARKELIHLSEIMQCSKIISKLPWKKILGKLCLDHHHKSFGVKENHMIHGCMLLASQKLQKNNFSWITEPYFLRLL